MDTADRAHGIPAYVDTEGSLPLLAGLMEGGMGPGPAMAFLVTGAGTSVGAVGGCWSSRDAGSSA